MDTAHKDSRRRVFGRTLLAGLMVAGILPLLTGPAEAKPAANVGRKINSARSEHGLKRLKLVPALSRTAKRAAAREPQKQVAGLTKDGLFEGRVRSPAHPAKIFGKLMSRPAIRANLLAAKWDEMGIGSVRANRRTRWTTVILRDAPSETKPWPAGPAPQPGTPTYAIPSAIAADCSKDVTSEINEWIASVPDNSTLVFGEGACYRIEREVRVVGRSGLTFLGYGALFRRYHLSPPELQWPQANAHFRFVGGADLTLWNMGVRGTNTVADQRPGFGTYKVEFEFEHAFAFHGVQGLEMHGVFADAVWGDGIYLAGQDQYSGQPTREVLVDTATIDRNGRQGVGLSGVEGALLDRVRILHGRRAGFDLEPPPGFVRDIEIRNSYTKTIGLAFASGGRGDVSNIYIHHNRIDGDSVPWIYVKESLGGRRQNWKVVDNEVVQTLGSPAPMLYFVRVDNVEVRRNESHAATTQSRKAVEFQGAAGELVVRDNDFTGACEPYLKDSNTGPVEAAGNVVSSC